MSKNAAARALGRRRWRGVSKDVRRAELATLARRRWDQMSPAERDAHVRKMIKGRTRKPSAG